MLDMVYDLIGITGWTHAQVSALTLPQFYDALAHRGRFLASRVQAELDVRRVSNLSDTPGPKGEPSGVQRVLDLAAMAEKGETPYPSAADHRYGQAVGVILRPYRGDSGAQQSRAEPFPGMSPREARALMAWVGEGLCPGEVWAQELLPVWERVEAAGRQPT